MRALLLAVGLLLPMPAVAQRVELPILERDLSDGTRRYAVTLTIGGRPVEVALDTGSTGLRVLPRALDEAGRTAKGHRVSYSYGAGTRFEGAAIDIAVGAGARTQTIRAMRIDRIGCRDDRRDCPATDADPATFGIEGNGLAGQGFAAILGIRLEHDAVDNPLVEMGATRWLVDLPRPGESAGRLVMDPGDDEIAEYRRIAVDAYGRVAGCLAGDRAGKVCGPAYFDTGAPGLRIMGRIAQRRWPQGTPVEIAVGDSGTMATMDVPAGRRDLASGVFYEPTPAVPEIRLSLGIAPYFHWSVLYDADRRQIGLKPR